jgi:hypothetical protein
LPRKRLTTEIALLLCAKLAALTLLYFAFFAPSSRPRIDRHAATAHLFSHSR